MGVGGVSVYTLLHGADPFVSEFIDSKYRVALVPPAHTTRICPPESDKLGMHNTEAALVGFVSAMYSSRFLAPSSSLSSVEPPLVALVLPK